MNKALLRTCFALTCLSIYSGLVFAQEVPFLRNDSFRCHQLDRGLLRLEPLHQATR